MSPKMKSCFQPRALPNLPSAALLFLRLVMGIAFLYHGWGKIQNPMEWMPPEAGVPGVLQLLAAVSEFGGGLALILGLFTTLAMSGMAITMLVATYMHAIVRQDPFVNMSGGAGYELALLYLALALVFITVGPGKFSADSKIFGQK